LLTKLGYEFENQDLLVQALTHRSYCAENSDVSSNERLEFLGDSVLGLVVTNKIFNSYPDLSEGQLAKLRASVVNTVALAEIAEHLELGKYVRLGKGEDSSGGRSKQSILADTTEAVIGAIYIDSGWQTINSIVLKLTDDSIIDGAEEPGGRDYKTQLQELVAKLSLGAPSYDLSGSGPDHDKRFKAKALVDGKLRGEGEGTSKKRAEQSAARSAFENLQSSISTESASTE